MLQRCCLCGFFVAVVSGLVCPAQTAAPAPQPAGTIRTHANLVLVDVVVTKDGKPVEGLKEPVFHVFENAREQSIASFEEHRRPMREGQGEGGRRIFGAVEIGAGNGEKMSGGWRENLKR